MREKHLVAIIGPTASGKSRLALFLAKEAGGEIINGDSRQVYRYMDIGTAKPSIKDREIVPHHLYDILNPDEPFSLAQYQKMALETIEDIFKRARVPFLVGGSGQYIWAILEGWKIPEVEPDLSFRQKLVERAFLEGKASLFQELERLNPQSARKIDPNNVRRIIRALEIYYARGPHLLYKKENPDFSTLMLGLKNGRKEVYSIVDRRVNEMISSGLITEVRELMGLGYGDNLPSMSSVGYKEILRHLKGELGLEEAISKIKFETHRIVRKQFAWFRERDERIRWLDLSNGQEAKALDLVKGWLAG